MGIWHLLYITKGSRCTYGTFLAPFSILLKVPGVYITPFSILLKVPGVYMAPFSILLKVPGGHMAPSLYY